mmetsp:Transcript_47567/g.110980  ORF Transcript_47567/g.110980 Transcript_47567/m.110980 type:complete len:202 (+) Transcript_47567:483-1088(+)
MRGGRRRQRGPSQSGDEAVPSPAARAAPALQHSPQRYAETPRKKFCRAPLPAHKYLHCALRARAGAATSPASGSAPERRRPRRRHSRPAAARASGPGWRRRRLRAQPARRCLGRWHTRWRPSVRTAWQTRGRALETPQRRGRRSLGRWPGVPAAALRPPPFARRRGRRCARRGSWPRCQQQTVARSALALQRDRGARGGLS